MAQIETPVLDTARVKGPLGSTINPFCEEKKHSWARHPRSTSSFPRLRVSNPGSGSHPDQSDRMQARLPDLNPKLRQTRKDLLTAHANGRLPETTPFISFIVSPAALGSFLSRKRSDWPYTKETPTVINSNVRYKKGLPMLNMETEMPHYGVADQYKNPY